MAEAHILSVEVCAAWPGCTVRVALTLPAGATVGDAVRQALPALPPGLRVERAASDRAAPNVGVFGRACREDRPLRDGDRVEIYRALVADPKAARQRRASLRKGLEVSS